MRPLALALCAALAASCRERPAPTAANAGEVVATVNGVDLTRAELAPSLPHGGVAAPAGDDAALERAIDDELLAQHARRLGVDRDPTFVRELRDAEARLRAWRRQRLAELAERREAGAPVGDPEARAWYQAHAAEVRAQVRVAQLLLRDEDAATRALAELRAGADFGAVAARALPHGADPAARPWELGPLRWQQVPGPWRDALPRLRVGELSGVIRGPNRRFWVVQLLERSDDPAVTFESARDAVTQYLQEERRLSAGAALRARLRREARVVRAR